MIRSSLVMRSTAFSNGGFIPKRHTCEGGDRSPALAWTGIPAGTKSLVMLCDDPDAPGKTWRHWGVFNLPPDATGLPEGFGSGAAIGDSRHAVTDGGSASYDSPRPPPGHSAHNYRFRLLALSVETLDLPKDVHCRDLEHAAKPHIIGESVLTGKYSR